MINIKVIIPVITIIIIIIAGILITFNPNEELPENEIQEEWIRSGSFEIDKSEYKMGDKIFLSTTNLLPDEKGIVQFFRPMNDTHHESYIKIPFNGMDKTQYS